MIQDHPDKMRQQKQLLWTLFGVNVHLIASGFWPRILQMGKTYRAYDFCGR